MAPYRPLPVAFFARDTLTVARELIGCMLWVTDGRRSAGGRIVESEAYLGVADPASHAGRGPTPRSAIMFGRPGIAYVYFIYGMHHCLNAVTEPAGRAGAVLLRALEPVGGIDVMEGRFARPMAERNLCRGPGRLCRALGIDLSWNGLPLAGRAASATGRIWVSEPSRAPLRVATTPRIGVRLAADRPFRFIDPDSACVSFDSRRPRV